MRPPIYPSFYHRVNCLTVFRVKIVFVITIPKTVQELAVAKLESRIWLYKPFRVDEDFTVVPTASTHFYPQVALFFNVNGLRSKLEKDFGEL